MDGKPLADNPNVDIIHAMTPIRYIRRQVFGLTQSEFAAIAGVAQASVSRWESGMPLGQSEMMAIRQEAARRDIPWDDRWFFEAPASEAAA